MILLTTTSPWGLVDNEVPHVDLFFGSRPTLWIECGVSTDRVKTHGVLSRAAFSRQLAYLNLVEMPRFFFRGVGIMSMSF